MQLLVSNILPLKTKHRRFSDVFEELIINTDFLRIATGYISTDALTELKKIIESNGKPYLELMIGMHHFDGVTNRQLEAIRYLDSFLRENNRGRVLISTVLKFHGKLYSFESKDKIFSAIVGSSNLSGFLDAHRNYESDLLVDSEEMLKEIDSFIKSTYTSISEEANEWTPLKIIEKNPLLEDIDQVAKVSTEELSLKLRQKNIAEFSIPIKAEEKSHLNVYFGKGRVGKNGFIKPRHWYESEIIVSKKTTQDSNYPKAGDEFEVTTDDGWKFKCKVSGSYSKNLRSCGDLRTLGRWLKGRLENKGVLKVGEKVTAETLEKYGRNSFKLMKKQDGSWFIDFST